MSNTSKALRLMGATAALVVALGSTSALAQSLNYAAPSNPFGSIFEQMMGSDGGMNNDNATYSARRNLQQQNAAPSQEDADETAELAPNLRRQIVNYPSNESAGTVVIDTPHTYLYYVLGGGKAIRYGIGVGREGFTWSGTQAIARKAEWPDWTPPAEMIARQPYLPRFMAGGPSNPLGARAMYLGDTIYRIHGTNAPLTIGTRVSSGCIRLVNADVMDLYSRVNIGTKVVVLPMSGARPAMSGARPARTVQRPAAPASVASGPAPLPRFN
jgi:lipoprotein-anchoring transpeptidase ErfK/SrfK